MTDTELSPTMLQELQVPKDLVDSALALRRAEYASRLREHREWLIRHRIFFYSPICIPCSTQGFKCCQDPTAHSNPVDSPQWGFLHTSAHTKLAVGTNRSGKSTTGIVDDCADCFGFRPWELPQELKYKGMDFILKNLHLIPQSARTFIKIPARVIIIAEDWDKADEIFVKGTPERAGLLTRFVPEDALACKPKVHQSGVQCEWTFKNGSTIQIDTEKSYINNPKSFEGGQYDKVHYDEPKKRELRDALARGLVDTNGYESFTLTPVKGAQWIKNEVFDKAGINRDVQNFFFHAKDNPHISQTGFANFLSKLDVHNRKVRGEGEWDHLSGLVYKEFSSAHVKDGGNMCDPFDTDEKKAWLKENATLYVSIDPHPKNPMTALLMVADSKKRLTVIDELYVAALIPEFCDLLQSRFLFWGLQPQEIIIDPLAFENDPRDGLCWADDFINAGLFVQPAPKRKAAGILATQKEFKSRNLVIASNCERTVWELQNYLYREPTAQYKIDHEKAVDKDDHCVECLYRLVLIEPAFIDPNRVSKPIEEKEPVCP